MRYWAACVLVLLAGGSYSPGYAQKGICPPAPTSLAPLQPDMFNAEQEQWLGEAAAEVVEQNYRMVPVDPANDYLTAVGEKLLAVLPATKMKFQFQIYESDELNAFSLAGGRVYVSSKMVAAFRNEDELAAVLSHEIGHIVTHQGAIKITESMRKRLHVTEVGDRADIFRKFHELMITPSRESAPDPNSDKDQGVADRVGMYALTRAGYQPAAFARIFDFTVNNKGKKGNALMDVLGYSNAENRRYREAVKIAESTPVSCVGTSTADAEKFAAWQKQIAERKIGVMTASAGEEKVLALSPPMGSELARIIFSPDGKYLLAQDDTTVFILQRSPLKLVLTIPAPQSAGARFSADSSEIIFFTTTLRVERWNIAKQARVSLHEVVYGNECVESGLSLDGGVLVCVTANYSRTAPGLGITLLDTSNSHVLLEKTSLFSVGQYMTMSAARSILRAYSGWEDLVNISFSPDGRTVLLGTADRTFSYDLVDRKETSQQGALKKLGGRHFTFVDNQRVLIENPENAADSQLVSFPEGKPLKKISMGIQRVYAVTNGNYALLRPLKSAAVGALDLESGKVVVASATAPMDIYGTLVARQTPTGGVQVDNLAKPQDKAEFIQLPLSEVDNLEVAETSPDGKYLVLSTKTLGGLWNLTTGKRMAQIRPFVNAFFANDSTVYFDFRKQGETARTQGMIDFATGKSKEMGFTLSDKALAWGDLFLEPKGPVKDAPNELEARDAVTNQVLWSKKFKFDLPAYLGCVCEQVLPFWWYLEEPGAKEELDANPALKPAAAAVQDKQSGIILEVVDKRSGAVRTSAILQDKHSAETQYKYVWRTVSVLKDYALVRGAEQTTAIYHLPEGVRSGEFFGEVIARSSASGWVIVASKENILEVVDVATTRELKRVTFATPVRAAWFAATPKTIQVLTADQNVHTIEVKP
jgi:hypothetical protein